MGSIRNVTVVTINKGSFYIRKEEEVEAVCVLQT